MPDTERRIRLQAWIEKQARAVKYAKKRYDDEQQVLDDMKDELRKELERDPRNAK